MLALLAVVFSTVTVAQVPNPRPNHWVSDQANILDVATEDRLDTLAETLFRTKHIEMAIVVVDDVRETPKQFATALFNTWKIGDAQTNTGILVLLVMGKRRLEIETGTGIEAALTSRWLADMQAEKMVPRFKAKDFGGGLVAGVQAIADHLAAAPGESASTAPPGEYRSDGTVVDPTAAGSGGAGTRPAVVPVSTPPPAAVSPPDEEDSPARKAAAGGAGVLGIGGTILLVRSRRRRRICTTCQPNRKMLPLSEVEDDKHLEDGQRKEEQLGSVDYEVMICPGCQDSRTLRHNKWFSGYGRCASCSYKTLSSSSRTVVQATYDHGGEVEVTEDCRHCSYHSTRTRYTSALTRPSESSSSYDSSSSSYSSSSSSSGGSWGGGSSSGGGAGSSW